MESGESRYSTNSTRVHPKTNARSEHHNLDTLTRLVHTKIHSERYPKLNAAKVPEVEQMKRKFSEPMIKAEAGRKRRMSSYVGNTSLQWLALLLTILLSWKNPCFAFTTSLKSPSTARLAHVEFFKVQQRAKFQLQPWRLQKDGTLEAAELGEEFHPCDSAETTTQFLQGLWQLIARGNTMVRGVSSLWIIFSSAECSSQSGVS